MTDIFGKASNPQVDTCTTMRTDFEVNVPYTRQSHFEREVPLAASLGQVD